MRLLLVIGISLLASATLLSQKQILNGHELRVNFAVFSPDGKLALTASYDFTARIYEVSTGRTLRVLKGHESCVNSAVFRPDGNMALTVSDDKTARIYEVSSGSELQVLKGHKGYLKSAVFSPDGHFVLTASTDNTARIYGVYTGKTLQVLKGHKDGVNSAVFSPDSKLALTASEDGTARIYDVHSGKELQVWEHKSGVNSAVFSPDGKLVLTAGDDYSARIFEVSTGKELQVLNGHKWGVNCAVFSPDGQLALTAGYDSTARIYDVSTAHIYVDCKELHVFRGVNSAVFSPDGKMILTACYDSTARIFDVSTGKEVQILEGHKKGIIAAEFSLDGKLAITASYDKTARIYEVFRSEAPTNIDSVVKNTKSGNGDIYNVQAASTNPDSRFGSSALNAAEVPSENQSQRSLAVYPKQSVTPDETSIGKFYALIIGNNEYSDPRINSLDEPINDAKKLFNVLTTDYTFNPENVVFLENAGYEKMITALDEYSNKVTVNDNLLIFYAGHGHWDSAKELGYWLPCDAKSQNTANWIRNSTIMDYMASIKSKHTLLISDACFSGGIFKTRSAFMEDRPSINELYKQASRDAMTSGNLSEVPDKSVFMRYLLLRLQENKEKYLPASQLFNSMRMVVMDNSLTTPPTAPQFGQIKVEGNDGGDFIFIRRQ